MLDSVNYSKVVKQRWSGLYIAAQ